MDLGLFRKSRTRFCLWVVGPLVAIALVLLSWLLYYNLVSDALRKRELLTDVVPEMIKKERVAEETVTRFTFNRQPGMGLAEAVQSLVNQTAQDAGAIINSLSSSEKKLRGGAGAAPLEVSIKAEGTLASMVEFINELQESRGLIAVELIELRRQRVAEDSLYECEMTLVCHSLSS